MKLLIDNCFSRRFAELLKSAGHDVFWAGEWGPDPGDEEILTRAFSTDRVLVTRDDDFGELIVQRRYPHAGMIRLVELSTDESAALCLEVLTSYADDLKARAIVIADIDKIRVRRD